MQSQIFAINKTNTRFLGYTNMTVVELVTDGQDIFLLGKLSEMIVTPFFCLMVFISSITFLIY